MKNFLAYALLTISSAIVLPAWSADNIIKEESLSYTVYPHYKYRPDGEPGRHLVLKYNGAKDISKAKLEIIADKTVEKIELSNHSRDSISVILPAGVGVEKDQRIDVWLTIGKERVGKTIAIPALRQWTVYIYPHSHVDIGYTNTQANVEIIHKRNLDNAIRLARETKDYPDGARFVWNPEVTWPIERYLATESEPKKAALLEAIKSGAIAVDAGYVSTNTSASNEEELFELFAYSKQIEKQTGVKAKTMVQVDIPGVSWGVVSTAAQMGIPYCLALFNGYDRTGFSLEFSFKPFWWMGPDGKSKVLFLQPGSYNPGALIKGKYFWPLLAGQTDPSKLLPIVKTDNPRENFIDSYLATKLPELEKSDYYPYDIFPMTWCMADNTPIDADLPEAVKSWNEEFAFPKLKICSATEMMSAFEQKYGDQLPVLKGDFTEYWTDGLGTNARQTGIHREVKERLIQSETLWSMLHHGEAAPRAEITETWRNIILGTEHTWAYMVPDKQPISDDILKVKFGFFETADSMSRVLLDKALPKSKELSNTIAIFNTVSWNRGGVVLLPADQSAGYISVWDENKKEMPSQRLSTGELAVQVDDIPALGARTYTLSNQKSRLKAKSFVNSNSIDNGVVSVKVDPLSGDVVSMKLRGQEYVDQKALCAVNSYRYLRGNDSPGKASKATNVKISIKENGPLVGTLLIESDAEGCNKLIREVSLTAGATNVDFNNIVDKIATTAKEGIHFGFAFDIENPVTQVDVPWGVMELEKDQLKPGNRNWIAQQRWVDISNDKRGVTWSALNACSFEHADMTANIIGGATESTEWIRKLEPSATIYSWALNNHWHTNFSLSQKGLITFKYRVLLHDNGFNASQANEFGLSQIQPLLSSKVDNGFSYQPNLTLRGDQSVTTSILKSVDNGKSTIIRLRSVSDKDQSVALEWQTKAPRRLTICDFNEEPGKNEVTDGCVNIPANGLITLRAEW